MVEFNPFCDDIDTEGKSRVPFKAKNTDDQTFFMLFNLINSTLKLI